MFVLGRPTLETLHRILATQEAEGLTYEAVGATRGAMPCGYRHDRYQRTLGRGDDTFARAVTGLRRWEAHRGAGLTLCPGTPDVAEGVTVVQALPLPFLSAVAACRIVYVVDEPDRFGFAYGTLPAHPEDGEEAFVVHRGADRLVTFAITAFSRPRHPIARLGGPVSRQVQRHTSGRYLDALQRWTAL